MRIPMDAFVPYPETEISPAVTLQMESVEGYPVRSADLERFTLVSHKDHSLSVRYAGNAVVTIPCGRCLTPVDTAVSFEGERKFSLEAKTDEEGYPVSCIDDEGLDVEELLSEEIAMNLPIRVLCKETCKGLCPVCGGNLNLRDCGCKAETAPTRFAEALKNALGERSN